MCGKMNIENSCDCKKKQNKVWNSIKHGLGIILVLALIVVGIQGCMMVQYGIIYHAIVDANKVSK